MNSFNGMHTVKKPVIWALVTGLVFITLMASFTMIPPDVSTPAAENRADDPPAYCSQTPTLYIVNKFGKKTPIDDNTVIYRIDGDLMKISLGDAASDQGGNFVFYLLSADRKQVAYPYGQFDADGNFSFAARGGNYVIGYSMTKEAFEACGGSGQFKNYIEYQDNMVVVQFYIAIIVLQPTPGPRPAPPVQHIT